jgi:hypothetical protein
VGVHAHPELLRGALHQLGEDAFGDQFGDMGADRVHAQDAVAVRVGDDLEEAVGVAFDQRFADRAEGELRLLDLVALLLGLPLGFRPRSRP